MIEIDKHIEILLLSNDCVIVPELGGFMAHQVFARYDDKENLFLPPLRTLGFNPQLKMNDSLLVQSYIEAYDISYPEALRRIADEVRELRQHLDNEGRYELNDIGTLYTTENRSIAFEPCEAGILTPSLYGLSTFEFARIENNVATTEESTAHKATKQEALSTSTPANEALKKIVVDEKSVFAQQASDEEEDEDDGVIRIKVTWLRNIAAAAAAIVLLVVFATPIGNSIGRNIAVSNLHGDFFSRLMPKDTNTSDLNIAKATDSIIAAKAKSDSLLTATKKVVADSIDRQAKKDISRECYCIVLASRVTQRNAKAFVEELKKNGVDSAYVYENNDIVRVVCGNFNTESSAQDSLRKLRSNEYFNQAWVYRMSVE